VNDVGAIGPYKAPSDQFTAMGDEYGLLLLMKRGRVIDFSGEPENGVRVFRTGVTLRGAKNSRHRIPGYPYQLDLEERCSCA
jgi:hypothetical protein